MPIRDILENDSISVSFEFFPPKQERSWERLFQTIADLVPLHPSYVSITYGAGGSAREHTHDLVVRIQRETGIPVVAHLTCVCATEKEIRNTLERYSRNGIRHILALRGDSPQGMSEEEAWPETGFRYAADLVAYIKKHYPFMGVGVAGFPEGHPATANCLREMEHLKAKVDAGADWIVTQLFFDNRDFHDFCDRCSFYGIEVPITPGIMPITSIANMKRIAELAAGARIPAALMKSVWRAETKDYVRNVGVHWAAEQARDLIDNGVAGIHLYTLNNSKASVEICRTLGLKSFLNVAAQVLIEDGSSAGQG
jgi:methylenetetrahydrofolate reductase (NADPH)